MKTRIISGAFLAVFGAAAIILGGPVLLAVLVFASIVGMSEFYKAVGASEEGKLQIAAIAAYAGCAAYYAAMYFFGERFCLSVIGLVFCAVLICYVAVFPKLSSMKAVSYCFGFVYVAVMLGFIYLIRTGEHGIRIVWFVFLSSWIADTCAYFAGRFFGRHKMAPVLSPKKTIEGAVGGIAGSALSGLLFSLIVMKGTFVPQSVIICAAGAVISIFGDLAASAVKRDNGIKDYGNLIPGHGGILDRFDSVIFTAPVIYFLSLILINTAF